MQLHWFGHSCFQLTFSDGTRIVIDPFDESVGYPVPAVEADAVTCSHDHFDHGYAQAISGNPQVIRTSGAHAVGNVTIEGIDSFHDDAQGAKRGPNVIFRYRADGLTVVHLGDLGHLPTPEQLAFIQNADVLLIPIGGFYTIDTDAALQVIAEAHPKTAVAMHFRTPAINFPISDESQFAKSLNAVYTGSPDLEFTAETMQDQPSAIVMAY
ncbi:MAG: MBL fold metallo-hydrolase [Clostridia bacterium]|nr:MBL fold metallo-hydrolase [Clostridia bacterium]